jgi:glutamate racemase
MSIMDTVHTVNSIHASQPIGVFDSGVGGLSVLKHLVRVMPSESYVYLGDTARVPYGNKSKETVQLYSKQCAEFLLQQNVKLIIIACNSASSLALEVVRACSNVPVIGVIEPSAHAACAATKNHVVGVIGTRATVGSGAYARALSERAGADSVSVIHQACPLFVPLAEEGWTAHPASRAIALEYMKPLRDAGADTVVLGCTHYPLLQDIIHDAIPDATLIDPGYYAALEAQRVLASMNALHQEHAVPDTDIEFFVTDIPATFSQVAKLFLGFDVAAPKQAVIDDHTIRQH